MISIIGVKSRLPFVAISARVLGSFTNSPATFFSTDAISAMARGNTRAPPPLQGIKLKSTSSTANVNLYSLSLRYGVNILSKNSVFFEYLLKGKKRTSVSTMACKLNGVKINTVEDLLNHKALTAEVTNHRWKQRLNIDLPIISIDEAVEILLKIAGKNDFTFYEYFLTDHFGHGRNLIERKENLNILSEFLVKLINANTDFSVFISSDHGNIEDMSVKTHTRNPALGLSAGAHSAYLADRIKSLTDIKKTLIEVILDQELSYN